MIEISPNEKDRIAKEGGFLYFIGDSMKPTIKTGCKLKISPVSLSKIQPGDIVIIDSGKAVICHRMLARFTHFNKEHFIEKGDNCGYRLARKRKISAILGKVREIEFADGFFKKAPFFNNSITGLKYLIFSHLVGLLYKIKQTLC